MEYRITAWGQKLEASNSLVVKDVQKIDENLRGDYGTLYGTKVNEMYDKDHFLKLFRDALKKGKIMNFEMRSGVYYLDWFEITPNGVLDHADELHFECDMDFYDKLDELIFKFYKNRYGCRTKALKNRLEAAKGDKDDLFSLCFKILQDYHQCGDFSKHLDGKTDKERNEIYKCIRNYSELFKAKPMKAPFAHYASALSSFRKFSFGLMGCFFVAFLIGGSLPFSILALISAGLINPYLKEMERTALEAAKNLSTFKMLDKMQSRYKMYGMEYDQYCEEKQPNLVDFIDRDLTYLNYHEDVDAKDSLERLSEEYSKFRHDKFKYFLQVGKEEENSTVDLKNYFEKLLDIEIEMYSHNREFGTVEEGSNTKSSKKLCDILYNFGWNYYSITNDKFLSGILATIADISLMNYSGYEAEICELCKLAIRYVTSSSLDDDLRGILIKRWEGAIQEIYNAAVYKRDETQKLDRMAREIEEAEIKSVSFLGKDTEEKSHVMRPVGENSSIL